MRIPRGGALRKAMDPRNSGVTDIAESRTVPSPVGGWNARDSLAWMPEKDAVALDNLFPRPTFVELRGGTVDWGTGLPALGQSLLGWNGPAGAGKLFVGTASGIFNVTAQGAVGAAAQACTNGKFQKVHFASGSGTQYLFCANGVDALLAFDGTVWTNPAITGVPLANIINLNVFKQRLFLIEKSKLSFWYLPVSSIAGAAAEFPLNQIFTKGGFCMAMATWSLDAGAGLADFATFITSEGEIAVFSGNNPADPANWSLIGVWFVGKPLGRRCFIKFKGDLLLVLQNGVFPVSWALLSAAVSRQKATTDKIQRAFTLAAKSFGSVFGWELCVYPAEDALLVNVPNVEGGIHQQYVMNTTTLAWCSFSGWNAECFEVFGGELYFAADTKVYKAWNGLADPGTTDVVGTVKTAFNYFGDRGRQKFFHLLRPILMTSSPLSFKIGINVDFDDAAASAQVQALSATGSLWDVSLFDSAIWGYGDAAQKRWDVAPAKMGFGAALVMRIATHTTTVKWPATDVVFEKGSIL